MITGPRRPDEVDGPSELHVVILDNNRRALLGTAYEDMLACIRCGACLNVCPVYRHVGGHAYDSVYSGPMGKVLTPLLSGGEEGRDLPFGSTLCGACTEACPVQIPLADLLVRLRADLRAPGPFRAAPVPARPQSEPPARKPGDGFASLRADAPLPAAAGRTRGVRRAGFDLWSRAWSTPRGYRVTTALARTGVRLTRRRGWVGRGPLDWTAARDLPVPAAKPFRARWPST
jgi:L-lactate dehydrogenase complex protein LldF